MDYSLIYDQGLRNILDAIEKAVSNHVTIDPVLAPGGTPANIKVSAFSYKLNGLVYNKAGADNIMAPGTSTGADEFLKILVCIDSSGTVSVVAGEKAATQAAAELPDTPANKLAIGYLEIPESFTSGTTSVTSGMCKRYDNSIAVVNA